VICTVLRQQDVHQVSRPGLAQAVRLRGRDRMRRRGLEDAMCSLAVRVNSAIICLARRHPAAPRSLCLFVHTQPRSKFVMTHLENVIPYPQGTLVLEPIVGRPPLSKNIPLPHQEPRKTPTPYFFLSEDEKTGNCARTTTRKTGFPPSTHAVVWLYSER